MNLIFRTKSYLKFLIKAKPASGYGIHSPFIFHFSTVIVLPVKNKQIKLPELEKVRMNLKSDRRNIYVEDFGTGKSGNRKVKKILSRSSSSDKICRLLYQIAKEFKPASVLELGTNLGLSAFSMALANSSLHISTIEGSKAIAEIAEENFKKAGLENISILAGSFEDQLFPALKDIQKPFLAFIDGNHSYDATMQYFKDISNAASTESLIIIDDIHKSEEMEKAWNEISGQSKVTTAIDLYQIGIVFFRHGLPKVKCNILF